MLSGVLVAAIIAIWAMVLVPIWVRRHDGAVMDEGTPRVLPRRSPPVVSPRGRAVRPEPVERRRPSALRQQRRRRQVLLVLGGACLLGTVGAVASLWSPLLVVLPALLLLAYAGTLRRHALAAQAAMLVDRRDAAMERARRFRDFLAPDAPAQPVEAETIAVASEAAPLAAGDRTWTPVPIPLPSYVTAAPAPRVVTGDWHEEDLLADGDLPGEASAYALGAEPEHRRAVGD